MSGGACRIACIVQARMTSTRLPGKVLMDLGGRTVLDHVLTRCRAIAGVDGVVCAVPEERDDDPVAAEAARLGCLVVRGPRDDVLARYHRAAVQVGAGVVMRVTSDCPLIDPALCAQVLALLTADSGVDYACNNMPPTFPHGLDMEVMRRSWLDRAMAEATEAAEREHVTPFIRTHPQARRAVLNGPGGEAAGWRWTLDYPEDLTLLREIVARLPDGPAGWDWQAAAAVMRAHPQLAGINGHHHR